MTILIKKMIQIKDKILSVIIEILNTGERPMLNKFFEDVPALYQFAYEFAAQRIKKQDFVLDYGCGGGYGSEYLSRYTQNKTIGFDIDDLTININKNFFASKKNLEFSSNHQSIQKLTHKHDLIISSQVIEHLNSKEVNDFIMNLKMLIKNNGIVIISTVNKNITSKNLDKPVMPFHEHEYYPEELKKLLKKYFKKVTLYGQEELTTDSEDKECNKANETPFKVHLIRKASQYEIVRVIARHLPLLIKSFILGYNLDNNHKKYKLARSTAEIKKCYILICECKNYK